MIPDNTVQLKAEGATKIIRILDALEDLDDVQHVWSNMDADEKELEKHILNNSKELKKLK